MEILILAIFLSFANVPKLLKILGLLLSLISLPFLLASFRENPQGTTNIFIIVCFIIFIVWFSKQFLDFKKLK